MSCVVCGQGTVVQGDIYVSAMPVDLVKKVIPDRMKERWYDSYYSSPRAILAQARAGRVGHACSSR